MIVRVYNGHGSSSLGSPVLIDAFRTFLPSAETDGICDREMRTSEAWKEDTGLLVFSATSVTQFKQALGEKALQDIHDGVFHGAFDFAGICAGACFASDLIKYRMKPARPKDPIKIQGTGLAFFNLLATGPAKSVMATPFSGESENIDLVTLRRKDTGDLYESFFWGGPALIPLGPIASPARILSVLHKDELPMSLATQYGQGRVTICAYHPEVTCENFHRWAKRNTMSESEWRRVSALAQKLDGTAFRLFLNDAGLLEKPAMKKTADLSAAPHPYYS